MKTIFKPLLIAMLVIAAISGKAQCTSPNFTWNTATAGQVTFTDFSFSYDSITPARDYVWRFGDGDTSHSHSYTVNHTYTTSGTYNVSLEIIDNINGCDSTLTQILKINLCQTGSRYSYAQTGFGDYSFTATNLSGLPGATTSWSFGDGGTATSATSTHHYTASGNYPATLIVSDASLSCADTSVVNLAVSLCSYPGGIDTTVLSYNPINVQFQPSVLNAGYTYAWGFGDGNTGSGQTVTHSFVSTGSYTTSVTVSDAITGCSATVNATFGFDVCGLKVEFNNWGNGLSQNFSADRWDSLSAIVSTYNWNFPGATPSSGSGNDVSGIVYPSTGVYSACIYLVTTAGCKDTLCKSITVSAPLYSISGNVAKSSNAGFIGTVYLISQDSIGHLVLLDSIIANIDSSGSYNYNFGSLPVDTYYVKAALSAADADYANYLPTYYNSAGGVLTWGTATPVILNSDANGIDIELIEGSNPGGPGFVGGYVSEGAGLVIGGSGNGNARSVGDALQGIQINLLTDDNQPVAYTYSDANGHYKFPNLALRSYKIYVEKLNRIPTPIPFTLTAENPTDSTADITVNSTGATGIDNVGNVQINQVYPNPVVSTVTLIVNCQQNANATLKLVDVLGRTALEQNAKLFTGENTAEINMEKLAAGIYQLVIQTGTKQITYKIVKAK